MTDKTEIKNKVQVLKIVVTTSEEGNVSIDRFATDFSIIELVGLLNIQLDTVRKDINSL